MKKQILLLTLLIFTAAIPCWGFDDVSFNLGTAIPQNTYYTYTSNGIYGHVRGIDYIGNSNHLSLWADFNGIYFRQTEQVVYLEEFPYAGDAVIRSSEYSMAVHTGIQFGINNREKPLRPKIGLGIGYYYFNTYIRFWEIAEDPDNSAPFFSENNSQFIFGWRLFTGLDLRLSDKTAFTIDMTIDHLDNLKQNITYSDGETLPTSGKTAYFYNISLGVLLYLGE